MEKEEDTLENLIELTQDSVKGYREAADLVREKDTQLAEMFSERSRKRSEILEQLRTRLREIDPDNAALSSDGTASGYFHQRFMRFRALFQDDRKAALSEVDRGESTLVEAFEEGMEDAPSELQTMLRACLSTIRADERSVEAMAEHA